MSVEYYYCALPIDDRLVDLARFDEGVAEAALFSIIMFENPSFSDQWIEVHPLYQEVRGFVERHPELAVWHFYGGKRSPLQAAAELYFNTVHVPGGGYLDDGFKKSIEYTFAMCDRPFNPAYYFAQRLRYSPPEMVLEIAECIQAIDFATLEDECTRSFCQGLGALYQQAAEKSGFAVFLLEN